jgi:ATP-dependent DNA ligase
VAAHYDRYRRGQMRATRGVSDRRLRQGSAGVAALHLGQHEGDELRYIGKVGTGFTRKSSIENRRKLDAITTAKSPLTKTVRTLKLRGSSRNVWRTWNTATALRKATSA